MPRNTRGGATLERPNLLATDALDLSADLSYPEILARAGAYRDPKRGIVHAMPFGPAFQRGGKWVQQTKTFPVAMSAEEARQLTKSTGERHDWYSPGLDCPRCVEPLVGWVLGGRKFQAEHDHVTDFDPALYGLVDAQAPEDPEADDATAAPAEG